MHLLQGTKVDGKMWIILKQISNWEAATIDWKKMEYRFVLVDKWVTYVAHTANQYITLCWLRLHTVIEMYSGIYVDICQWTCYVNCYEYKKDR